MIIAFIVFENRNLFQYLVDLCGGSVSYNTKSVYCNWIALRLYSNIIRNSLIIHRTAVLKTWIAFKVKLSLHSISLLMCIMNINVSICVCACVCVCSRIDSSYMLRCCPLLLNSFAKLSIFVIINYTKRIIVELCCCCCCGTSPQKQISHSQHHSSRARHIHTH